MSEDWKQLTEIESRTFKSNDGCDWRYEVEAFSDIIVVKYLEGEKKHSEFTIPTFCAGQLCRAIAGMADKVKDDI